MVAFVIAVSGQVALPKQEATNTSGVRPAMTKLPPQQPVPNTGRLSHDFAKEPDSYLVVDPLNNGAHMFVKFEDPKSHKLIASMFLRAGAAYSVSNQIAIPSDDYLVKVASGTNWYGTNDAFGPDGTYSVMRPPIKIEPYTRYYLRLRSAPKGVLREEDLRWSQF